MLQIVFIVINLKLFSSTILIATLVSFVIFSYQLYEKENLNHKAFKSLARAVVVNMILSLLLSNINRLNYYNTKINIHFQ